jgi:cytochrome d ubiquinol oxidase subunit I
VVAGVGAYYLLARRDLDFGRRFVRAGVIVGLCASLIVVFPTGDGNGKDISNYQPAKLAAMEGLYRSQRGAPLSIIGMPDVQHNRLIDAVEIPAMLSFLAYGNFQANVKGIDEYPTDQRPPIDLTYYAYHVMLGLGTIFIAIMALAVLLLILRRLYESRWLLWIVMLATPFPYIANEAGWTVTEVGRQPWIIYGLTRTMEGASPTVVSGETIFTIIGFAGMYFVLGMLFLLLVLREIAIGPEHKEAIAAGPEAV